MQKLHLLPALNVLSFVFFDNSEVGKFKAPGWVVCVNGYLIDDCRGGGIFPVKKFDATLVELFVEKTSFKTLNVSLKFYYDKNIKLTSFSLGNECKLDGADWLLWIECDEWLFRRECCSSKIFCSAKSLGETYHRLFSYF